MCLTKIEINNLRNLTSVKVTPHPFFNVIWGLNGSGKTSFLEAIHYLGLGRSFRTSHNHRIIQQEAELFSLIGHVQDKEKNTPIGIERLRKGDNRTRVGGENAESLLDLAKIFPLQFINADAHRLLMGGPKFRRQFLDWGVFHVEHSFMPIWQRTFRALKQRNAALQMHSSHQMVQLWDKELATSAQELHILRHSYMQHFKEIFIKIFGHLLEIPGLTLTYQQGWPVERSLEEVLIESIENDMIRGYTQYGPQRADLQIRIKNTPAQDLLSQGQQKLLVYAMRLAQGMLLDQQIGKRCIYLIDDMPAELDSERQQRVLSVLKQLNTQVFMTCIEPKNLGAFLDNEKFELFHVEQGEINPGR